MSKTIRPEIIRFLRNTPRVDVFRRRREILPLTSGILGTLKGEKRFEDEVEKELVFNSGYATTTGFLLSLFLFMFPS